MTRIKTKFIAIAVIAIIAAVIFIIQSFPFEPRPDIKTVRVGVLPDEDTTVLKGRYAPLLEHLARETGLTYHLVVPAS